MDSDFTGSHILSVGQFSRENIQRIFSVADSMEPYAQRHRITRVLEGAILSNMFFEPSTRTRISFGSVHSTCWAAKCGKPVGGQGVIPHQRRIPV